jgi:hypothetical protein
MYIQKHKLDTSLSLKANSSDVNTSLNLKANSSDVYTKTQVDTSLGLKANLASPSFTGTPTIGTNPIAVKPWVSGRFGGVSSGNPNITGTASNVGTGSGVQSFTVTRQSAGTYNITWTTAHPSGSVPIQSS